MTGGGLAALFATGCFSVLACYSIGAFHPDARPTQADLSEFVAEKLNSYDPRSEEVTLWKATESVDEIRKAQADGLDVVDQIALTGEQKRQECGEDFACLVAWAEAKRQ